MGAQKHTPRVPRAKRPWPLEGVRGNHSEGSPERFFFCQAFSFWRPKKKMPSASLSLKRVEKNGGAKFLLSECKKEKTVSFSLF